MCPNWTAIGIGKRKSCAYVASNASTSLSVKSLPLRGLCESERGSVEVAGIVPRVSVFIRKLSPEVNLGNCLGGNLNLRGLTSLSCLCDSHYLITSQQSGKRMLEPEP